MEKLEKDELVTLDNNKEYIVVDTIIDEGNKYVYLSFNTDDVDQFEVMICKEVEADGDINLELLTDKKEIEDIANKMLQGIEG